MEAFELHTQLHLLSFKHFSLHGRRSPPSRMVMFSASNRESRKRGYSSGRLVDENMITLRMRIREMKMLETSDEEQLPLGWMEWEKKLFLHYNEHVYEALGFLQNHFMNTRPCLALGLVAVAVLCVPISTGVVLFHFMHFSKDILSLGFPPLSIMFW
eukprot:XP_002532637.2 uncharacterized protein LOC8268623 [Ricinus communis]